MLRALRPAGPSCLAALLLVVSFWLAPAFAAASGNGVIVQLATASGRHPITVEWAVTPDQRAKGLMFRKSMPADSGMMFDFGSEQSVDFWMKNTPLSLDMVFIGADGTVRRIAKRAKPYSEDVIPGGASVRYVLEINGGRADALRLMPGDKVMIPAR